MGTLTHISPWCIYILKTVVAKEIPMSIFICVIRFSDLDRNSTHLITCPPRPKLYSLCPRQSWAANAYPAAQALFLCLRIRRWRYHLLCQLPHPSNSNIDQCQRAGSETILPFTSQILPTHLAPTEKVIQPSR
jgi:hypothetical protein